MLGQGVRVSGGDLCAAEAPTESTDETQRPLTFQAFCLSLTKGRLSKYISFLDNSIKSVTI